MIRLNDYTPNPEIEGLSPNEIYQLIHTPWDDNDFPLKFNKELKYSDIKDSVFFTNTTTFLKTLIEMENIPTATAKGNLNRKIVKIIFDKLILPEDYKRFTLKYNKVINEEDVFPLHIIRTVCESAELIFQSKNRFLFSEDKQHLLSEQRAGELYHLLFISFFRKFNLGYLDRLLDLEYIQHTLAYSIYMLGAIADSWVNMEDLSHNILLPAVIQNIRGEVSENIKLKWIVRSRIINPLQGFGLLECSYVDKTEESGIKKVRKTRLFDSFMKFEV